jgi:hypothetical protein
MFVGGPFDRHVAMRCLCVFSAGTRPSRPTMSSNPWRFWLAILIASLALMSGLSLARIRQ